MHWRLQGQAFPPLSPHRAMAPGRMTIHRPGETVQVMAMLRDAAGLPADIPATVTVKRPNGQVFSRTTPPRTGDASVYLPVVLSSGAAAGTWHVEISADPKAPAIGSADFR